MRLWLPIAVIAAGVCLIVYALLLRPSDEDRIRERLDRLASAVGVREDETNPVARGTRLGGELGELFAPEVPVSIPELGGDRRELAAAATQAGAYYRSADVSFGSVTVRVEPGRTAASASATATLAGIERGGGERRDTREVSFELERIDGDWRITALRVERSDEED